MDALATTSTWQAHKKKVQMLVVSIHEKCIHEKCWMSPKMVWDMRCTKWKTYQHHSTKSKDGSFATLEILVLSREV